MSSSRSRRSSPQLDKKLTEQINLILHHDDFQKLEGAWRGLHYLVNNTETDEMLKIRVMNISKHGSRQDAQTLQGHGLGPEPDLQERLRGRNTASSAASRSAAWSATTTSIRAPPDVELLGEMAKTAAAAHCPFIAGASPTVMQMGSWQELANPRDLTKIFQTPEYAAWRSLRESEDSRYIGLAMPRFLARLPYGAKTDPVEEFDFEEDTGGGRPHPIHVGELGLRDGDQHHPVVQAVRLVLADSRRRVRRRGRRACPSTRSRPTMAAWT